MYKPRLGYTTVTWGAGRPEGWLEQGMKDISSLGYKAFETFAADAMLYDDPPGKFRQLLKDQELHLVCLDVWADYEDPAQTEEIVAHHKQVVQFLTDHGGDILLTVPMNAAGKPRWGLDEFKAAAEALNQVGKMCLELGAKNALHPHWGTFVETQEEIERILDMTDPEYVFFAPDSGQIAKGDTDPVAMVRKYVDRVAHVHLKDVAANWPELRKMGISLAMPEGYAELGQGTVDTRGFIEVLAAVNYDGYMLGELDRADDAKASAEISKRFLLEEMGFSL